MLTGAFAPAAGSYPGASRSRPLAAPSTERGWPPLAPSTFCRPCAAASRAFRLAVSWLGGAVVLGSLMISCSAVGAPEPSALEIAWREGQPRLPGASLSPLLGRVVRYCDMLTIEEGREFRVMAVYQSGFESSELVDRYDCLLGMNYWVKFAPGSKAASNRVAWRKLNSWSTTTVVFRGSYRCGGNFGHEDFYNCLFTVSAVEKVFGEFERPWR